MLDLMYELPAREDVREFVITAEVVRGELSPIPPEKAERDIA